MNVLIIEDEFHTAIRLEQLLKAYDPAIQILDKLASVEESIQWLEENKSPDLIFQDIELSDGKCFEIYKEVDIRTPIIFTTAYSEYALKAFELNSIDYIVKPYDKADIKKVLEKYDQLQDIFTSQNQKNLEDLFTATSSIVKNRFLVRIGDRYKTVISSEVHYIRYEQGVSFIFLSDNKKYPVDNSISELEEQLDKRQFFQINRKYIVNIKCIQKMHTWFNNRIKLEVTPDPFEEIIVSRDRTKSFKKWLDG